MDSTKTPKKILLETTVQLLRIAGGPSNRKLVSRAAAAAELLTTSFVLREFIRTIVKDIVYVHSMALKAPLEHDGRMALAALDLLLASGRGNFSVRSARRERYVTAAILAEFRTTVVSRQRLLVRLERTAQQWLRDFFEVDIASGGTARVHCLCTLDEATEPTLRLLEGRPFPAMPNFPAGASSFLQEHRFEVHKVEDAMEQAPSKWRDLRLLKLLDRLKDEHAEYDFMLLTPTTQGNWHLGDLLIVLEAPRTAAIFSLDRHFAVLCPALRRTQYDGLTGAR
jgi:uncharacterized protein (DUF1778 family)